jgi:hypothetical protein
MEYKIMCVDGAEKVMTKFNIGEDPELFYKDVAKNAIHVGSVRGTEVYYNQCSNELQGYDMIVRADRNNPLEIVCYVGFKLSSNNTLRNPFARLVLFLWG